MHFQMLGGVLLLMELIPEGFSPFTLLHRGLLYHDQARAGPKPPPRGWSRPSLLLALDDGALSTHASIPSLVGERDTKLRFTLTLRSLQVNCKYVKTIRLVVFPSRLIHSPGVFLPPH